MTDHGDDERALRAAFARLREEEARRAPTLARLVARASEAEERARTARLLRLRFAFPLAGAAMAALAWWITAGAPQPTTSQLAAERARREAFVARAPLIALGSLRSPTDALLELEVPAPPRGLSDSLIPGPPPAAVPHSSLDLDPTRRNAA